MGKGHGDRLTSLDASFLHMESSTQLMHIGGLFLFDASDAPGFDYQRFVALIRSRLHLVPRYRQKLAFAPMSLSAPMWVDDPSFDLAYHVRHAALPAPGTTQQLMEYSARVLSKQLDRDRPLWELYVIEGIEGGSQFAIVGKNHHAMIDGAAGIDIATVMLDFEPNEPDVIPDPEAWSAAPTPSGHELAWSGVRDLLGAPRDVVEAARGMVRTPLSAVRKAARTAIGVTSVLTTNLPRPAPRSSINRAPGPHRRFAIQRIALEDVKRIKNAFGTTVNDVVLAMVADATGRFLRARGDRTEGLWLKAMVPVSVRAEDDASHTGNKVASVFVSLPMFEMDPVERLQICHEAMSEVKDRHHALGADFLVNLTQFAPPTIHAAASRAAARARLYNFLVTNVPGPQLPIYCLGARLMGGFPFTPLASTQSYAVGLTSIDGWMNFGFTADWDALPDVELVTGFLVEARDELVRSAEAADTRSELTKPGRRRSGPTGVVGSKS
ncbi:MAG TPA: wax ester/triacylglycerol synthase family O-acyltransferase [Nitriliruptorales bacterium]